MTRSRAALDPRLGLSRWASRVQDSIWTRGLLVVAFLQIAGGVLGFFWGIDPVGVASKAALPNSIRLLSLLAFGASGSFLFFGSRSDRRATCLGAAYLLIATLYSDWLLRRLMEALPAPWPTVGYFVQTLEVGAFVPTYLWLFVRHFPDSPMPVLQRKTFDLGIRASVLLGTVLFVANLSRFEGLESPALRRLIEDVPGSFYSATLMLLSLLAFAAATQRARQATGPENRRFRLFIAAIVVGLTPIATQAFFEELFPAYMAFSLQPVVRGRLSWVLLPLLLSVPFTTSYAVLVHQVLEVRLIARRALQYALARTSALVLAAVPMTALVAYLTAHRDQSLAELFSGPSAVVLLVGAAAGAAALGNRQALLDAVDRRFFREQYDARRLLGMLVEHLRGRRDVAELAALVSGGVDRALHLENIAVLVDDSHSGSLVDPEGKTRSLDSSSALAMMAAGNREPLEILLDQRRSPLRTLPEADRHWLVDGRFRLLVPMISTDGSLLGLLALGGKKSELPFLPDDRELLTTVAGSASLALELQRAGPAPAAPPVAGATVSAESAGECGGCGRIHRQNRGHCRECGGLVEAASVPFVLPGKLRFDQRVGLGGMGVVYRATDLGLARTVAVKTLRRLAPEDALRLRREARTAAAFSHPNLAAVYGVETWHGTPLLILEYLSGGTLRERLVRGPLALAETLSLGSAMASALAHLHASDLLHRDVKPSNIGYGRGQVPKLMDFGIARLAYDLRADRGTTGSSEADASLPATSIWNEPAGPSTGRGQLVGTLPYLSPEAAQGLPVDTRLDLWSLAVVLYECLAGSRLFSGTFAEALERIQRADVPDLRRSAPDVPEVVAAFFREALHRDPARRPKNASDLGRRLDELADVLGA